MAGFARFISVLALTLVLAASWAMCEESATSAPPAPNAKTPPPATSDKDSAQTPSQQPAPSAPTTETTAPPKDDQTPNLKKKDEAPTLPEVIVTAKPLAAQRVAGGRVEVRDATSSVDIIDEQTLNERVIKNVDEALRTIPGVDVTTDGYCGPASVNIRGMEAYHTVVIMDGIEMSDPSQTQQMTNFSFLTTNNVAQIEVLKGPQSVLYGSNAIGGVVYIRTKPGEIGPPQVHADIEGGSFDTTRDSVSIEGGSKLVQFSFGYSYEHTNGYPLDPYGKLNDSLDEQCSWGRLDIHPGEWLDLTTILRGQYANAMSDYYPLFSNTISNVLDDPNYYSFNQDLYARQEARMHFFDNRWESMLALNYAGSENRFTDAPSQVNQQTATRAENLGDLLQVSWHNTVQLPQNNTLNFGVERKYESANTIYDMTGYQSPWTGRETIYTDSVFLQDQVGVWDRLFLTLGGRYDNHELFGSHFDYTAHTAAILPGSETKLLGGIGTGFRAPSILELTSANYGDPHLKPETNTGWETGFEQPVLDKRIKFGATYFNNVLTDMIENNPQTFKYSQEGGASRVYGVETFISAAIRPNVDLNLGYTYLHSVGADGLELELRPENKCSANVDYRFLKDKDGHYRGTVSFGVNYVGKQRDYGNIAPNDTWDSSHTVARIAGNYQITKHFKIHGRIENAFNERYQQPYGYAAPPIGAFLGLGMDW